MRLPNYSLEWRRGFEPPTFSLATRHSTTELPPRLIMFSSKNLFLVLFSKIILWDPRPVAFGDHSTAELPPQKVPSLTWLPI